MPDHEQASVQEAAAKALDSAPAGHVATHEAAPAELASSDQPLPRVTGPLIVAAWGAANALMTSLDAGMGGKDWIVAIQGVAVFFTALIATAAWLAWRRRPEGRARRQPSGGGSVLLLAVGFAITGWGLAFDWWISVGSTPIYVAVIVNEAYLAHKHFRPGRLPPGTGFRLPPQR